MRGWEVSLHHTDGESCPLCVEKLKQAHLYLVQWFLVLKRKYPNVHVSWAWRGQRDQDHALETHASALRWPFSAHNHTMKDGSPCSMALDLFQLDEDGVARWSPTFFSKVNAENEAAGEPIQWGGKFKSFGDSCHFQFNAKV